MTMNPTNNAQRVSVSNDATADNNANENANEKTDEDITTVKTSRNQRRRRAKAARATMSIQQSSHQSESQDINTTITAIQSLTLNESRPAVQEQLPGPRRSRRLHIKSTAVNQNEAQSKSPGKASKLANEASTNSQHDQHNNTNIPLRPATSRPPKPSKEPKQAQNKQQNTDTHQHRFENFGKARQRAMEEQGQTPKRDYLIRAKHPPIPTPAYLKLAQEPSTRLSAPRRLLVVLDVNGVLGFKKRDGTFLARPHATDFLRYVHSQHVLMIWSSAPLVNIHKRCDKIFEQANIRLPRYIWSREHWDLPREYINRKVELFKRLSWVWDAEKGVQGCAIDGQQWDQTNTVLIDDDEYKGSAEPSNLIKAPSYLGHEDDHLDVLGKVVEYLEEIRWQKNVSAHLAKEPFVYDSSAPFDWDTLFSGIKVDELEPGEVPYYIA